MAELTALESKLGEVLGLAMAAQDATQKVGKLVEDEHEDLREALQRMAQEAKETEERTTELASELDGKKTAILEKARETKQEATEMMSTYLGDDADALDGFEFLTMAEAGEVGHWSVVRTMNERARVPGLQELVEWVTPIQQRHFQETLEGSVELAADEDPNEPA
jgi:vacuolar-type H+-ATPase subunit H